jgi:hypothetical protein
MLFQLIYKFLINYFNINVKLLLKRMFQRLTLLNILNNTAIFIHHKNLQFTYFLIGDCFFKYRNMIHLCNGRKTKLLMSFTLPLSLLIVNDRHISSKDLYDQS